MSCPIGKKISYFRLDTGIKGAIMYNIYLTIGNKTFSGILEDSNLTEDQIQKKGMALFQPAIAMSMATIKLKKHEVVEGKDIESTIMENLKIEWQEIKEPEQEGIQKIYEIEDLSNLTRLELIEQQILNQKKAEKIQTALDQLHEKEIEEIKTRLKENKNG